MVKDVVKHVYIVVVVWLFVIRIRMEKCRALLFFAGANTEKKARREKEVGGGSGGTDGG
jgi:hypothetical protein